MEDLFKEGVVASAMLFKVCNMAPGGRHHTCLGVYCLDITNLISLYSVLRGS